MIEETEGYLKNQKLAVSEYNKDTIYEAELRAALNSLELSTDNLYMDINHRICLLQRQQILLMQTMLLNQLKIMRDEKGNTLYSHSAGEVAKVHKCKKIMAKVRSFSISQGHSNLSNTPGLCLDMSVTKTAKCPNKNAT